MNGSVVVTLGSRTWGQYSDLEHVVMTGAIGQRLAEWVPLTYFMRAKEACRLWNETFGGIFQQLFCNSFFSIYDEKLVRLYGAQSFRLFLREVCTIEDSREIQKLWRYGHDLRYIEAFKRVDIPDRFGYAPFFVCNIKLPLNHEDYLKRKLGQVNLIALMGEVIGEIGYPDLDTFIKSQDIEEFFKVIHNVRDYLGLKIPKNAEYSVVCKRLERENCRFLVQSIKSLLEEVKEIRNSLQTFLCLCIKYDFLNMKRSRMILESRTYGQYFDYERLVFAEAFACRFVQWVPVVFFGRLRETCKLWNETFGDIFQKLFCDGDNVFSEVFELVRFYGMTSFQLFLREVCTIEDSREVQKFWRYVGRGRGPDCVVVGPFGPMHVGRDGAVEITHEEYLGGKLRQMNSIVLRKRVSEIRCPDLDAFIKSEDINTFFQAIHEVRDYLGLEISKNFEYSGSRKVPVCESALFLTKSIESLYGEVEEIRDSLQTLLDLCIKYDFLNMKDDVSAD